MFFARFDCRRDFRGRIGGKPEREDLVVRGVWDALGIAGQVHSTIKQIMVTVRSGGEVPKFRTRDIGRGTALRSQRGHPEASALG